MNIYAKVAIIIFCEVVVVFSIGVVVGTYFG